MTVTAFDHVAVPAADPQALIDFYRALGFVATDYAEWKASGQRSFAVHFGDQKLNFHAPWFWQDPSFTLRGHTARPGCGDFCFVWAGTTGEIVALLQQAGAAVEVGPVDRVGGRSGGRDIGVSVYSRDPDGNLIEFIVYP